MKKSAKSSAPQSTRRYWLFKSEPSSFGIEHLAKSPRQTAPWDGVRNYQARNFLRDDVRIGDRVLLALGDHTQHFESLPIARWLDVPSPGFSEQTVVQSRSVETPADGLRQLHPAADSHDLSRMNRDRR